MRPQGEVISPARAALLNRISPAQARKSQRALLNEHISPACLSCRAPTGGENGLSHEQLDFPGAIGSAAASVLWATGGWTAATTIGMLLSGFVVHAVRTLGPSGPLFPPSE